MKYFIVFHFLVQKRNLRGEISTKNKENAVWFTYNL